jgi:hypothetical protein
MIVAVITSCVSVFGFIICLLFTIGDLITVTASPTGFPIIEVYYKATKSVAGTNALALILVIILTI